jgi:crotonobetaine/carnitine-CoA ligase
MSSEETLLGQTGYKRGHLFTTVEEVVAHARETVPADKILVQWADGGGISFSEYLCNVNKICNMFLDLGIEKKQNHHVGVFLSNCIEYTYLYTALGLLGVPMVPLNPFLKGASLEYVINRCDVRYLITNKQLYAEKILPIASSLTKITHVLYVGDLIETDQFSHVLSFARYTECPPEFTKRWDVSGSDVAVIWLTSGTTGLPKGVETTHEYLFQRTSFSVYTYFRMTPSDVIYFALPMYHIPFHNMGLFMAMISGCTVVTVDWFSASKFWQHIAKYGATVTYATGTVMAILLKKEVGDFERQGREHLRLWMPWPLHEPDVAVARWPKTNFIMGYGLTEYAIAATNTLENPEIGSQGPPTPFTDLKICDPDTGMTLPVEKVGEIVVRSKVSPAYMMRGYYNSPEDTKEAVREGWFHTGDGGYLDERGHLHFVDRLKDSVRVGGENVPSVQVEGIINGHPKIAEVAIVGVKGELGPEMLAHVVLKDGEVLLPDEFFEFCAEHMAYFMVPRYLRIREELPKTATMRVQKFKLREEGLTPECIMRKEPLKGRR